MEKNNLRLDVKYSKPQEIEALNKCLELTGRNTYSSVIRECTSNYPRLLNELDKLREENKTLKAELNAFSNAISNIEEIILNRKNESDERSKETINKKHA